MSKKGKTKNKLFQMLKMNIKKKGAKIFQKMGLTEVSRDSNWDKIKEIYKTELDNLQQSQKRFAELLRSINGITIGITRMSEKFTDIFKEFTDDKGGIIDQCGQFDKSMLDLCNSLKEISQKIEKECMKNIITYEINLKNVSDLMVKREDYKIKYDKQVFNVKKLDKKRGKSPKEESKLSEERTKLEKVKNDYYSINREAKENIVAVLNEKADFLAPFSTSFFDILEQGNVEISSSVEKICERTKDVGDILKGGFKGESDYSQYTIEEEEEEEGVETKSEEKEEETNVDDLT